MGYYRDAHEGECMSTPEQEAANAAWYAAKEAAKAVITAEEIARVRADLETVAKRLAAEIDAGRIRGIGWDASEAFRTQALILLYERKGWTDELEALYVRDLHYWWKEVEQVVNAAERLHDAKIETAMAVLRGRCKR